VPVLREADTAKVLRSLLPPHLPHIPGVQVAARYLRGGHGADLLSGGGRTSRTSRASRSPAQDHHQAGGDELERVGCQYSVAPSELGIPEGNPSRTGST
jgi:hypothetical protein